MKSTLAALLFAFACVAPASGSWWWSSSSGYTKTEHPIVLAHGMAGFDSLFGVYDYWLGIPSELRAGGATVFVSQVPSFASTEARGEVLLAQVEYFAAIGGTGKVNLIGHSHGGLDARYVAAVRPDLIASVTTVGSPNHGAELADFLRANITAGGFSETVISTFADGLGVLLGLLSGTMNEQDSLAALDSLSSAGMATFNARYPQGLPGYWCGEGASQSNGIRFYSWTGISTLTHALDLSDPALMISSLVYSESNDGLVGRCSSHFGDVIYDRYRHNHLDEVNQLFGFTNWWESSPTTIFRSHANRLKNAGL